MHNKLMIKLFVASEAFFFLALIVAYIYFWHAAHFNEEALNHLNIRTSGFFTVILLTSSLTFYCGERSYRRGGSKVKVWLVATVALGAIFLLGQAKEYYKLLGDHMTVGSDEFGSSFFTLTGFHGLHVLLGLVILLVLSGLLLRGVPLRKDSDLLSTVGIYWHFVDLVWLILFTLIYVLPHFFKL